MPFTPSHAAAVLPLRRWRLTRHLPLSALIIGSIVPDLAWLLPVLRRADSHSALGILLYGLPAGWVAWLLFRHVLREPACALFARPLERLLLVTLNAESRRARDISLALLLGAASHVLWDGFTHYNGHLSRSLPWLRQPVWLGGDASIPVCDLLQHLSSLGGLLALSLYAVAWIHRGSGAEQRAALRRTLWRALLLGGPLLAGVLEFFARLPPETALALFDEALPRAAAEGLKAGGLGLLGYALTWHARRRLQGRRRAWTG